MDGGSKTSLSSAERIYRSHKGTVGGGNNFVYSINKSGIRRFCEERILE